MSTSQITSTEQLRELVSRTTAWREASTGGEAIAAALRVAREAPQDVVDRLAFAKRIVVAGAGSEVSLIIGGDCFTSPI